MTNTCPFCTPDESKVILANPHAQAISDNFPISPGHTLIIPKRHIASFFELTKEEQGSVLGRGKGDRLLSLEFPERPH